KNSPLPTNQRTPLRNEVELSPKHFLAETSTKGASAQDLRPKFQPIYQMSMAWHCTMGTRWVVLQ
ncbi:MAG TPA: hypothetical protein VGL94_23745, partial [Ktedonobacteraceae bacterium]